MRAGQFGALYTVRMQHATFAVLVAVLEKISKATLTRVASISASHYETQVLESMGLRPFTGGGGTLSHVTDGTKRKTVRVNPGSQKISPPQQRPTSYMCTVPTVELY